MPINEHFEKNFNAVLSSAIVFQQPVKSGETREITFTVSADDKNRAAGMNIKIIHLEVELDDDGEIKAIRRETVRLEKNNVRLS